MVALLALREAGRKMRKHRLLLGVRPNARLHAASSVQGRSGAGKKLQAQGGSVPAVDLPHMST